MLLIPSLCMVTSCMLLSGFGDPDAETKGYKVFNGQKEGFRIRFEYSENWRKAAIRINDPESKAIALRLSIVSLRSVVTLTSNVNRANGGEFIDSKGYIDDDFREYSQQPEFKLIERKNTVLGSVVCEEIIYSYRFIFFDTHGMGDIDRIEFMRTIAADYKGRIYSIDLYSTPPEYENIKNDFEHLVRSFKFLN